MSRYRPYKEPDPVRRVQQYVAHELRRLDWHDQQTQQAEQHADWTPEAEGGLPIGLRAIERTNKAEAQAAKGAPRRAAYASRLGPAPQCTARDHTTARRYAACIVRLLDESGWTHSERGRLHRLYRLWSKRAAGDDPRFNRVGNRAGRKGGEKP